MTFGWSALDEIYRENGYFAYGCEATDEPPADDKRAPNGFCPSQSAELGNVIIVAGGLCGVLMMIAGVLRDQLGFGPGLFINKVILMIGYMILASAKPGESDLLLYGWVLQYGTAASILIYYL